MAITATALGTAVGAGWYRQRLVAELRAVIGRRGLEVPARLHDQVGLMDRLAAEAEERATAARDAEERLRGVLEGFPAAVLLFDARGEVREANAAGERLRSGRHGEVLVMDAVHRLLGPGADAGSAGTDRDLSSPVDLAGPPRRRFTVAVRPLADGGRLAIVEDVSERRRLEEVRRDFVANISHELKTPIGAIALLAETMTDEHDPELLARLSGRVHREALRVGSTIDDLLLLSRIESAEPIPRAPVAVVAVVAEAVERVHAAAEARGIAIRVEEPDPAVRVPGDRSQLVSAVYNLLDNAVKYSEDDATVVVRARLEADGVALEVVDTGVGIPARDLERVFERFYRVDRARSRRTGGTGLGLAIVRHIAENHGGTVRVSSREGSGSTFVLQLPTVDPHVPAPGATSVVDGAAAAGPTPEVPAP